MRIAQIAPIVERIPPKKYGGTERVIYTLIEELVKLGHDVTLFASGDSVTSAKLVSAYPESLREAGVKDLYGMNPWTILNIGKAYSMQGQFDIIHDHTGYFSLPAANLSKTPVVYTYHGPFKTAEKKIFEELNRPYIVTISNSQGKTAPNLNFAGTVYNGLNMQHYPFSDKNDGYLLFVGRISLEKGVHFAIEAAQTLNMPLIIAAKLETNYPPDVEYFKEYIEPRLSGRIRWIGEVSEEERNQLMSKALAFLHPVTWREPFGLTLIEAAACGAPVVAFNRGSIPEIILNGKTGFVVEDVEEMAEAVLNIGSIDRAFCRKFALENFNGAKMAREYEQVYKKIIARENQPKNNQSLNLNGYRKANFLPNN